MSVKTTENKDGTTTVEVGGVVGVLLGLVITVAVVLFFMFGLSALVTLAVGALVLAALASVWEALTNLAFRLTHGGKTRREVAMLKLQRRNSF